MATLLRIGARGSPLSLTQTGWAQRELVRATGADAADLSITPITTTGDRIQDRRLIEAGGKGLFTKELDDALLDGRIDLAVHSLKDVPTQMPPGLVLAATPKREDPRDAIIAREAKSFADLPRGALIGAASLRRLAQALHLRPDLKTATLRGNVETRLSRVAAGNFDATFLGLAGLNRLGLAHRASAIMAPDVMLPAIGQGALAITARADDARILDLVGLIDDEACALEVQAERAFLQALDGSCRASIAGLARYEDGALTFRGEALTPDGARVWRRDGAVAPGAVSRERARDLGAHLGASIKDEAGDALAPD
jgi:hydroxymethylbilane synthase